MHKVKVMHVLTLSTTWELDFRPGNGGLRGRIGRAFGAGLQDLMLIDQARKRGPVFLAGDNG
ncbi:hypothetical protein A8V01_09675 [Novosphingobium guangzhouense]|uniref:Uncharacterized protein n=1 Tax=Novosphingobium guangzhouense TaxID=1850347 RepID=A0A2K2FTM2_9SPHN|nr:hypothetical protein A8V01_09675 [Novosphingobium guangzhouense]